MSESNSLLVKRIRETTYGEVPSSGDAQIIAVTGETLKLAIDNARSERITDDRNNTSTIQTGARGQGGIDNEFSFDMSVPEIESALFNTFSNNVAIANTAADTEITAVDNASNTITVAAGGAAFVAGSMVLLEGFTNPLNNGVFKVASSTATTIVLADTPTLTDEAAPPKGARIKRVGHQATTGDIDATLTGLTSSTLDFTTLGLVYGQWIKIGGADAATKFDESGATDAEDYVNNWVRITKIEANTLTLDNLPPEWEAVAGTGKDIILWIGDFIRNGKTKISHSYELAYTSQDNFDYYLYRGFIVDQLVLGFTAGSISTLNATFLGKDLVINDTSIDATPIEAPDEQSFNAIDNVARVLEAGQDIADPNLARSFTVTINNGLAERTALGFKGATSIRAGDVSVVVALNTYFGNKRFVEKYVDGSKTSVGLVTSNENQGFVVTVPNARVTDNDFNATGRNQDVECALELTAEKSRTDPYSIQIDRFEYVE